MSPWAHPDEPGEWPGMTRGLPARFKAVLDAEPDELFRRAATFCFWHEAGRWHRTDPELPEDVDVGDDPQGARYVLECQLDREPAEQHVAEYHERPELIPAAAALLDATEAGSPLTAELVAPFADKLTADDLLRRAREVGLPATSP
jgi:hypothetical protein